MLFNILILLVDIAAGILAGVLLLRFWMQAVRVRPPAPIGQFVYKLSDWLVQPLRRVLPGLGGFDWACLVGAMLVALLATSIHMLLTAGFSAQLLVLLALLRLVEWVCYGLMGLIFIEVIFSWINPHAPLAPFVQALNEPMMRPLRRVIPLIGGIDLSPLAALVLLRIALQLATELIVRLL